MLHRAKISRTLARCHPREKKVRITHRPSFIPVFTQVRTASTDPLTHRPQAAATGAPPPEAGHHHQAPAPAVRR
jgi:hypothetical protein